MRTIELSSAATFGPQSLLSTTTRLASALAVVGFVAVSWLSAGHASHEAVQTSAAALSRNVVHVTLPPVEIVGRREMSEVASLGAAGAIGCERPARTEHSL
jgi:hypothetical protein